MAEPSWQDLYDVGKATLVSRRPTLRVQEGDVTDAIIAGCASMGTAVLAFANNRFRATFLDGAVGTDLVDRAHERGVDKDLGDQAIGRVTLSRASFAAGAGILVAGTKLATEADDAGSFATFTLDEDTTFGPTALSVTEVPITCTVIGVLGNVDANTVTRILDTPAFDPSITVTNPEKIVGGLEEETDAELRDRARAFFLTLARGTRDAIIYGAKTVNGVSRVTVDVDGSGIISVYVADDEGNSNAQMISDVTDELAHWVDAADVYNVYGGSFFGVLIDLSLTVRTGTSIPALIPRIQQAVVSRLKLLNPGDTLYRDAIASAAREVDRQNIVEVVVNTPAANVTPSINQAIRTTTGDVTFS